MTKKTPDTVTVARITLMGTILVALISVLGNLILGYWQFISKPGPASESNLLAIEQIPQQVYAISGNNENLAGSANLQLLYGTRVLPTYILYYNTPKDKIGYAGLLFRFSQSVNISEYSAISFIILFQTENDGIDIYLKDISNTSARIRIIGSTVGETEEIIPLKNFAKVNLNAISEVKFYSDSGFMNGSHEVAIHSIQFVR
jgi:hypothetical protein